MNVDKLAKLQAQVRIGGKGTPRRKVKKVIKASNSGDDRKLSAALTKLGVQPIGGVDEVNMFRDDGKVIHFASPKVQSAANANTFAIHGRASERELAELVPNILNQLDPSALANLRKLAEAYQAQHGNAAAAEGQEDEDIPDLVENFDSVQVEDKESA